MGKFLRDNVHELLALTGVAMLGVGVGLHDVGAGLAVAGLALVGLVTYAVHRGV